MKIEFDPISRTLRFLKFFIMGLVVSVWLESVMSDFLYSTYKISVVDFWTWGKFFVESLLRITPPASPKLWGFFLSGLTQWQNALAVASMVIFPIGLAVAADMFFLWYQRTHMQSKNK